MRIGTTELLIILAIILLLFGPSQIPKLTRMIKGSAKSFKAGMEEEDGTKETVKSGLASSEGDKEV